MLTQLPNGKGVYIWKSSQCANGSFQTLLEDCKKMGLTWVAIKIGDAANDYYRSFSNMVEAVEAFRSSRIKVYGWHYIYGGWYIDYKTKQPIKYGASPKDEALFANEQVSKLNLDGYIIDAEKEYKISNPSQRALDFMSNLNISVPVGLSSYRFPSLHPEFPWKEFLDSGKISIHMPQVYWNPGGSSSELIKSIEELKAKKDIPFIPAGRAYIGDGHPNPSPEEIISFMDTCGKYNLKGLFFWAMDFLYIHPGGNILLNTIAKYNYGLGLTPPPVPAPEVPEFPIGKVMVTANILNVRSGPDATNKDVGDLVKGNELYFFERSNDWVRIGLNSWIKTGTGLSDVTKVYN